ncbi:hypothetical protein BDZ85DRAFT_208846 [Elsinoe ampelina]|uniref:Uncharacterized protein n=1 Tax=Elsinoe ampelina TaxID=302913 RepID=A0A6A6FXP8_9PEZI|nr:hypothetical protein BDZ85DRAFT_208846 [Elsinoe ampelina]
MGARFEGGEGLRPTRQRSGPRGAHPPQGAPPSSQTTPAESPPSRGGRRPPKAPRRTAPAGPARGRRREDSYLVDSASSHMLVSKIKPCMSKYKQLYGETANGSLNQLSFI